MAATKEQAQLRTVDEPAEVRFTPHGVPLAVRWRGRLWPVVAEPVQEFRHCSWPEPEPPAAPGAGPAVEAEFWRLQVQATSASPLYSLELGKPPGPGGWRVTQVSGE